MLALLLTQNTPVAVTGTAVQRQTVGTTVAFGTAPVPVVLDTSVAGGWPPLPAIWVDVPALIPAITGTGHGEATRGVLRALGSVTPPQRPRVVMPEIIPYVDTVVPWTSGGLLAPVDEEEELLVLLLN